MTPATLTRMTSKGTTRRTVRIADDLWNQAAAIAAGRGEDLSAVIRDSLRRYVRRHTPALPARATQHSEETTK